jgi:hypothetical protein
MASGVRKPQGSPRQASTVSRPSFETDFSKLGKGAPAVKAAHRAVPETPGRSAAMRNLRAISAQQVEEELPNMLPFDSSRIAEAGYSSRSGTLYVRFVDGTPWEYRNVEPNEWRNLRRSASPGRYVNRVLNNHDYGRSSF